MRTGLRFGLGIATTLLAGSLVAAAVRENLAVAAFERCAERWELAPPSGAVAGLARELAQLDRELAEYVASAGPSAFAPFLWKAERREELGAALADVAPLLERMRVLLESEGARRALARGRALTPTPRLAAARDWANVLAAKAVHERGAESARWLALSFDLATLRCQPSSIGTMIGTTLDSITLTALRDVVARPDADATALSRELEGRLVARSCEVPWRDVGRFEAALVVRESSGLVVEASLSPFDWWRRASTLDAVLDTVDTFAALADGELAERDDDFGYFAIFARMQRDAVERASVARVALRCLAYREECGNWPAAANELAAGVPYSDELVLALDVNGVELSVDSRSASELLRWTIPAD
ncbi:MAG: hypothetical protein L6Q99_05030 [Planctomycetes bacterium]|nr:hypothetical protein [Planctomycetota bacterium]